MENFRRLNIFISSCSDVNLERIAVAKVINNINKTVNNTIGIELKTIRWEDMPPLSPNLPEEQIQDVIDKKILDCNIFILIMHKRYGTVERGYTKSNLEREIETAISLLKSEKKIMFLSYFKDLNENNDPGDQEQKIIDLRERLGSKGIWYSTYGTEIQFKEKITHDLYRTILRYTLSTSKYNALKKFWQTGIPDRPTHPNIAIIYPPIDRSFMGESIKSNVWEQRLQPNIVFEDFKALQKIEKSLRLVKLRSYRIYNTACVPDDIRFMNAFWICIPRNNMGIDRLSKYKKTAKFEFVPKAIRSESIIYWRPSIDSDVKLKIKSPLSKYLKLQREYFPENAEWLRPMANIIAKDYAVLARLKKRDNTATMEEGIQKEFFLAGIRGLGTWGAGWFIDRCYEYFLDLPDDEDIQLLLEILYKNGRIEDVVIVSNKNQSYFNKQNHLATIKKNIENFNRMSF